MEDAKVWKVTFRTGDQVRYGDLVFIAGTPHLVWEWYSDAANEYPGLTSPLDPNHLQKAGPDFVYGQDVPRPPKPS